MNLPSALLSSDSIHVHHHAEMLFNCKYNFLIELFDVQLFFYIHVSVIESKN